MSTPPLPNGCLILYNGNQRCRIVCSTDILAHRNSAIDILGNGTDACRGDAGDGVVAGEDGGPAGFIVKLKDKAVAAARHDAVAGDIRFVAGAFHAAEDNIARCVGWGVAQGIIGAEADMADAGDVACG